MSFDEIKDMEGAFDVPDTRDYDAVEVLGEPDIGKEYPSSLNLNYTPSHNQARTMHCTAYGITHVEEILNTIEHSQKVSLDPEEQWANQAANRGLPASIGGGDSLQNALQTLRKKGLVNKDTSKVPVQVFTIDGYAKIDKSVDGYKKWLVAGYPVYTGWKTHCFAIIGYDDTANGGAGALIAKNSYGPNWGKNSDGTFNIAYNEIPQLFTGYIVYDTKDLEMVFRDVSEKAPHVDGIRYVLEKGIMKGYDHENIENPAERFFKPNQPVTRAELATIIHRLAL